MKQNATTSSSTIITEGRQGQVLHVLTITHSLIHLTINSTFALNEIDDHYTKHTMELILHYPMVPALSLRSTQSQVFYSGHTENRQVKH